MRMCHKARRLRVPVELGGERPFTSIGQRDRRRWSLLGLN
jgi:hypothetical protein